MTHQVYLVSMDTKLKPLRDYRKVGHASDSINRTRGNQTGNPIPLILLRSIEFENKDKAVHFEQSCHRRFANDRVRGEWFEISDFAFDKYLEEYLAKMKDRFERDMRIEARTVELAAEMRAEAELRVRQTLTGPIGRIHSRQLLGA